MVNDLPSSFIPAPNKLWLAITNACGLRCPHCLPDSRRPFHGELSRSEVLSIVEQAGDLGVKRIAFTGGEPMLIPYVYDYVAAGHASEARVYLETSHPGITPAAVERLAKSGLDVLNLSIDSPDAAQHDEWRGRRGLFEKMIETARYAVAEGLDVRIYCTVTARTIERSMELPGLIGDLVCAPTGGKLGVLTFAYFVPVGRGGQSGETLAVDAQRWHAFCAELDAQIPSLQQRIGPIRYEPAFLTRAEHAACVQQLPYDFECIARGRDYVYINPLGDVYGCVLLAGSKYSLGSLRGQSLADIWLGSSNWGLFNPPQADHGHQGHRCSSGCPALAALQERDTDPRCESVGDELIPICPLTQLPMIEDWPYMRPTAAETESR